VRCGQEEKSNFIIIGNADADADADAEADAEADAAPVAADTDKAPLCHARLSGLVHSLGGGMRQWDWRMVVSDNWTYFSIWEILCKIKFSF
jgi:hypothetical protein